MQISCIATVRMNEQMFLVIYDEYSYRIRELTVLKFSIASMVPWKFLVRFIIYRLTTEASGSLDQNE